MYEDFSLLATIKKTQTIHLISIQAFVEVISPLARKFILLCIGKNIPFMFLNVIKYDKDQNAYIPSYIAFASEAI